MTVLLLAELLKNPDTFGVTLRYALKFTQDKMFEKELHPPSEDVYWLHQ